MYFFIVNRSAGSGRAKKIWERTEKLLISYNIEYKACYTEKQGDGTSFAKMLTEDSHSSYIIIIVGGDGTVNEVINGLNFAANITIGLIPAGSGNDLAKGLKLSSNPKKVLKKILHPKYHMMMDYGVVSYGDDVIFNRRFAVSCGIGFDAAVIHNILYLDSKNILKKLHVNRLRYVIIGIIQILKLRQTRGYIILDGIKKVEFDHIIFISSHIYPSEGGGFNFAPKANPSDGKISVCLVHNMGKLYFAKILVASLLGNLKKCRGVRYYECSELKIHAEKPLPVHVDGESCFCQTDIQMCCIEKKIRMIV